MAADPEGWTPLDISSGDELCAALAVQRAHKTRSNIQNN
jgi:hypothetical protein